MNYSHHIEELGMGSRGEEPVIFMKPDSSILRNRRPFFLPDFTQQLEYEAELVVRISKLGKNIEAKFANRYWDAITLGIDFTARDLQRKLCKKGMPWELSKCFDSSAVLGDWIPKEDLTKGLDEISFHLEIDNRVVQRGYSGDMIFSVAQIIEYISRFCTLKTGDLIFTGTPVGVGKIEIGNHLMGYIEEKNILNFHIR